MSLETDTVIDRIMGRAAGRNQLANSESIKSGVEQALGDVTSFSLYLDVDGATNIQIELSPDGGRYYEPGKASNTPAESPIKFEGAGTEIISFAYDADSIRLTASNDVGVTAELKEVV